MNMTIEKILANLWPHGDCLEWSGPIWGAGYPAIRHGGRTWRGNRLIWTLLKGPIPAGLLVCHKCDNRKCMNVKHLFLGTHSENTMDASRKGRLKGRKHRNTAKTHCPKGHDYSVHGQARLEKGSMKRHCTECERERSRKRVVALRLKKAKERGANGVR